MTNLKEIADCIINKNFDRALNYFILAYRKSPENVEILNYLGLTYNFLEDFMMSEIYYQEGLAHDPKNKLINQKLGELYFKTKRIDLAKIYICTRGSLGYHYDTQSVCH